MGREGGVVNATPRPLYRRLGGPQRRSRRVRKILPLPGFDPRTAQPVTSRYTDFFSFSLYAFCPYMFRDCPGFCLFAFTVQHTHTSMPPCTLFVLHPYLFQCVDCPAFCLLSVLTTYNTNIHAPCWIRTHNPSRQAATDPRLRPLGHWDLQLSYPGSQTMTMSQSLLHNLCRGSSVVK